MSQHQPYIVRLVRLSILLVGLLIWPSGSSFSAAEKPNIVFLLADDQCYETLGLLGLTDIDTPNLDRLARQGARFTRAYNMGSWSPAVCVASRAMLITGRSLWDAERAAKSMNQQREAGRLWPQLLKQAGYRTYLTGKWHISTDAARCFDVARHVRGGMPTTVPEAYNRPFENQPDAWRADDPSLGGFWSGGRHWSEVVADDVIDFLRESDPAGQPSFIYAAFNAPHDPRQSPREFLERYPLERIAVPRNALAEYPFKDRIGCSHQLRDENLAPMPRTEFAVKTHRREYFALITHLDEQVGRILTAIERSPQGKNTWIVFTADHGLAVGHHGLFGKQNLYEHSTRVPFLIAGPGVVANLCIDEPIYLQDAMATTLGIAGANVPEQIYFQDLRPLLTQTARSKHQIITGAYLDLQRSVTHDGWKLIAYPSAKKLRLYDLKTDPDEFHDRADDDATSNRRDALFEQLLIQQQALGDALDLRTAFTR